MGTLRFHWKAALEVGLKRALKTIRRLFGRSGDEFSIVQTGRIEAVRPSIDETAAYLPISKYSADQVCREGSVNWKARTKRPARFCHNAEI
jgi:hypothetical protein